MGFLLDLLILGILSIFSPKPSAKCGRGGENSANWIILDDLERDGKLQDKDNEDPFLNGDYDEGPDW